MDLEKKSIERIRTASEMSLHHYEKPLICTYSGGKDSDVMLHLFEASGVPFEVTNSLVSVDAPETVYHIRDTFQRLENKGIKIMQDKHIQEDGSRITMWNLIVKKGTPPTRRFRFCCANLKENNVYTRNRMISTGVRWAESNKRKNRGFYEVVAKSEKDRVRIRDEKMLLTDQEEGRMLFEKCELKAETIVNPIIDWEDSDVWDYIHSERIKTNHLYECGFYRVGCIGCPMAGYRERERALSRYPKFRDAYIFYFGKMLEERERRGMKKIEIWENAQSVFDWWIEKPDIKGQLSFDDVFEQDLIV